ncbi:MAG: hypothetical protein Q7R98_00160 [Candidatus Jorgensenbacteria bacterium]|nr:hypothetical protein [Candidatus Jorgensenbacteria bacterium]
MYSYNLGSGVVGGNTLTARLVATTDAVAGSGIVVSSNSSGVSATVTIASTLATLHVIKAVVNTGGGTALPANFSLHVTLSGGAEVSGSPQAGTDDPGTSYSLSAGTYIVSEDAKTSYTGILSGGCNSGGSVTLSAGQDKTCTITNTYVPPLPEVASDPISGGSGGGSVIRTPLIGILKVPTPLALPGGFGPVTYNYTVWNVGGKQALTDVSIKGDTCSPIVLLSGDLNSNNKLDPGEIWKFSCTKTLSKTTTNTAVATGYSDDGFRQVAIATAIATVVVGEPLTPPLINIIKVPSRLTPFSFGGGNVTYTYTVTNPGVVAMSGVTVTDDKCGPVSRVSGGDANSNNLLDPGEIWTYTCKTNVPVSTRNVATAEGEANGFTAIGYAFATVLVSAPSLPNTGLSPVEKGTPLDVIVLAVILLLVSVLFVAVFKKTRNSV